MITATIAGVVAELATDAKTIAKAESLVRREYERAGYVYKPAAEPVMIVALEGEEVVGVLCARPDQMDRLSPGFAQYAPALTCPFILPLGKVVTDSSRRGDIRIIQALFKAMHEWGTSAGYSAFFFETPPALAKKYVRAFGFAPIGEPVRNPHAEVDAVLLFSSANNPRLCSFLFGTK